MDRIATRPGLGSQLWHFARHFLEMCAAMCIGGGILNGLVFLAGPALLGYADLRQQSPELALLVAALLTGLVNSLITLPFSDTSWFVQAVVAAVATVVTLPYGVLVGVLLYLDLRARKENLNLERLRADLQASAA